MGLISRVSSRTYRRYSKKNTTKMTLTDDEVHRQIQIMVSFIDQEAKEKAEEIEAKAEEEFQIEKGRIVQQQRQKIQDHYDKKQKQLDQQKLVQHSHMLNRCRLATLKARDDQVAAVLKKTEQALISKRNNQALIQNCIVQALLQANEPEVTIRCIQDQQSMVQGLLNVASTTYSQMTQQTVKIELDTNNFLPAAKIGGIVLITKRGRLTIDNTLVARLHLISQQLLPEIRGTLFGENPNRKFKD